MTNAEAVNWLINITADIGKAEHSDLWHYEQALSEIREMLEDAQPETHEERTETHACDCVSRVAAIEAIEITPFDDYGDYMRTKELIEQLPSAQPKSSELKRDLSDTISRQAALDAMDTWDKFGCDPDGRLVRYDDDKHYVPYVHYDDMVHAIKALPSEQPQRKSGKTLAEEVERIKRELTDIFTEQMSAQPYSLDEWCETCGEYNHETHSCPRFNRVIRTTLDDVKRDAYKHGKSKGIKRGMAMAKRKEAGGD